MKAVDYFKEKARMTEKCSIGCDYCKLSSTNNEAGKACSMFEIKRTEQAIEIVEKWSKENPVKTYLSVLLEKLPNVELKDDGIPYVCISAYFGKESKVINCIGECVECWNTEYKKGE